MNVSRYPSLKRVLLLSLLLFCAAGSLSADYTINSFNSDIIVGESGRYEVREDARLTFHTPMHGFYRTIPTGYELQDGRRVFARLSHVRSSEEMKVESSRYETVIRLGSADRTITGAHDYAISYRYDLGEDLWDDRDEFYFNLVGTEWDQKILSSSFTVTFPLPVSRDRIEVLRGAYGSVSTSGVSWSLSSDGKVLTVKAQDLMVGEAVTVRVVMEEGYFTDRPNYTVFMIPLLILVMAGSLFLAYRWWSTFGKDRPPVIVPLFKAPEGLTPLDAGYLIDRSVDAHDLTSMIFYWADRGNLTIIEERKKFSFVKGAALKSASSYEQEMFTSFFNLGTNGVVTEKDLKNTFYKVFQSVKSKVEKHYSKERSLVSEASVRRGVYILLLSVVDIIVMAFTVTINYPDMFTFLLIVGGVGYMVLNTILLYRIDAAWYKNGKGGKFFMMLLLVLIFLVTVLAGITMTYLNGSDFASSLAVVPLGTAGLFMFSFFTVITRQRSEYGQKKLEEVLGLRDFIETVEMDELKRMIDTDPQFYYRLLSYAIVLGLEKKWAKKFSSFSIEPPTWYSGNRVLVGSMMVSSVIHSCDHALITNVAPPKTSSSGGGHFGAGGGGFSGGGFGGGGGGGW